MPTPQPDRLYLDSWEVSHDGGAVRLSLTREDGAALVLHLDVPIAHALSEKLIAAAARAQLARQGGASLDLKDAP